MKKAAGGRRTPERPQGKPPGKSGVNKAVKVNLPGIRRGLKPEDYRSPTQRQKL